MLTEKLIELGEALDPFDFEADMITPPTLADLPDIIEQTADIKTEHEDDPQIVALASEIISLASALLPN